MGLEVENIRPYKINLDKRTQIEGMFDGIAQSYDFMNHLLSMGFDIWWRRRAVRELSKIHPREILDMATGTGDFALESLRLKPDRIIGVDISANMIEIGKRKAKSVDKASRIEFIIGDGESLDFPGESFDGITVGFGVRNFQDLEKGLTELNRVLKKGGMITILEPSFPSNLVIKALFRIHFQYITPWIAGIFSTDTAAYAYLHDSVKAFPEGEAFCTLLGRCGFKDTKHIPLSFGICALYTARK